MTIEYKDSKRISSDQYKVHSFTSSGTFTVTGTGNVEYLVVAGGGAGGGNNNGGGGGAGGFRTGTGHAVTAQGYTITVGAGGSGNSTAGQAPSGGDSTFSTITSTGGGGGGGGNSNEAGSNGGSGGGAAYTTSTSSGGSGNTPSTTPSQGNDGGDGSNGTAYGGGGGGGSGSVGVDATTIVGGNGGDGTSSSITGSALFYSGGGGGGSNAVSGGSSGSGGSSIGGNGAYATGSVAATNGTTNTGSGGGGCQSANTTGGNGGSGIVIIRYKTSSDITATGGTITTVTDAKPTDVQDNSILVEKATGKRYWFSESGTTINFPPTTTQTEFTTQGTPDDMVFSQDGLHLYTVDGTGALSLGEYTLTTAWDISTASHTRNKSFSYGSLSGVSINNDGTKIYVVDYTTQKCHQLDLSTAYNISTATDNGVWKYVTGGTGYVPTGIHFKPDGTRAYVVDQNPDQLTSYTLSTAWDLSTLSYDSVNKSLSSQNPEGMVMNYTGTKIWVLYNSNDTVQEWTLSTAWDLSTATANATTWDFSAVANTLSGGDTNSDDSTIYFLNSTGKVLEYPPTPATWTFPPTFEDDFSSSAGWTQVTNTASGVSGGELIGLSNSSGTNGAGVWKDYGLIFDNDKFVLRCKFQIVTQSGGSGNASSLYFGLSDTNGATSPHSARDGFGIVITNYAASGMLWTYPNGTTWDNADTDLSLTPTQTTYYLEIARTSATSVTFTLYSDEYNTVVKTHTQAITSTLNDLRYLMFQEWRNGSNNTTKVAVSELKLYNKVGSV